MQINPENFGINWEGPVTTEEESNHVEVPETMVPLGENAWLELQQNIDPKRPSAYHGVDIYMEVLQFITERL